MLFIGQVGNRVAVFFQYKTNVAVKVKYLKAIDFPCVTVCNQNNFRFVNFLLLNVKTVGDNCRAILYCFNRTQLNKNVYSSQ